MNQENGELSTDGAEPGPIVAILLPATVRERMLSPAAEVELANLARLQEPTGPDLTPAELPALLNGAVACITGWGTPPLTEEVLAACPDLKLVAHTAGSIRKLVPAAAVEHGLLVSHAAPIIADAVAEFVISQTLLCLRPLHLIDAAMKGGEEWFEIRERRLGRMLGARTVGVVGAGYVGRAVIRLFKAFGCPVLVHDPLLAESEAAELGVALRSLDDLLAASDVVTLHAPVLPQTRGMIGAAQLALMPDSAVFINSARAALVDETALLNELRAGRITAALDVFADEPLPADSPFRTLANAVVLSPHAAGHTRDTYRRQGSAMVDEVRRFLAGEPLGFGIGAASLATMA